MAQVNSGSILREARERKGMDLNSVARRLRIRPDILRAIEEGDFSAMPPRGYTRNMVNAYARLLGLNPTEIVNMYLDEAYANQVERARGSSTRTQFDMGGSSRFSRTRTQSTSERSRSIYEDEDPYSTGSVRSSALGRTLYDDRTRFSRDDYGTTRQRQARADRSSRDFMSHHSGYDGSSYGRSRYDLLSSSHRSPRQRSLGGGVSLGAPYQTSGIQSLLQSRLALIIGAIVIVVIIIIVLFVLLGGRGDAQKDDVATLPVSGINDTTQTEDGEATAEDFVVEIAPTSARVTYSVKDGMDCYVQVYDQDNKMTPLMLTGPYEESLEVTDKWGIATYAVDALTVTVDGEKVELQVNEDLDYMYTYTVDFNQILDAWNASHPQANSAAARRAAASAQANQNR